MLDDNQLTVLTDPHRKVMDALEKMGVGLMEEVDFPPYRADLYLPDYHVIVEIDGPLHNTRRDLKRDVELRNEYGLMTFRISSRNISLTHWAGPLRVFLDAAINDRDERWEKAELRVPWL